MENKIYHAGIIGQTQSGKTFLAQAQAKGYRARGFPVLVCDPFLDPNWPCDFMTDNMAELLRVAHQAEGCAIFIDEAGQTIGLNPSKEIEWLTTGSRHRGHFVRICGQRGVMINRTMRDQLGELYLFNVNYKDADEWAECFNEPELKKAVNLPPHYFIHARRFEKPRTATLWTG
jgi:hypothetical protein